MVGIGAAARRGILIRDAAALDLTHAVSVVAFDKTGTLTEAKAGDRGEARGPRGGLGIEGKPRLVDILVAGQDGRRAVLSVAAGITQMRGDLALMAEATDISRRT
jgi:P-type Cu+ transporter